MSEGMTKAAPRIVVGVDGSPSSRVALRWAVRQAVLTGGTVDAVSAFQVPAGMPPTPGDRDPSAWTTQPSARQTPGRLLTP